MKTTLTLTGTKEALEAFKAYFEGIEAVTIFNCDDGDSLLVAVRERDAGLIKQAARHFGCTAKIK